MNRAALFDELRNAFSGVGRDPDQSLHQAHLTDQGMRRRIGGAEWAEAGRLDPEESWEDVSDIALDECDAALSHATPASWKFYLPAFMRRALAHFVAPDYTYEKLSAVLFHLTYTPQLSAHLLPRFELLDQRQRRAVRHFLELVEEEAVAVVEATNSNYWTYEAAVNALDSYWRENGR